MSSSDDDGLPAWMSSYKSPVKRNGGRIPMIDLSTSDDDDRAGADGVAQPAEPAAKPSHSIPGGGGGDAEDEPQPSKPAKAAPAKKAKQPASGKRPAVSPTQQAKPKQSFLTNMSSEKGGSAAKPEKAKSAADAAAGPSANGSTATAKQRSPGGKASAVKAATASKAAATAKDAPATTAADATAAASAAAAVAPDSTVAGKPAPKLVAAPVSGELPVMLPEKLQKNRMIAELESVEGGATDLTGDSGAVGRVLVHDEDGQKRVQFDLKGIVYDANLAQLPGTLCVVNIGQTEAKVEAVMHSFLQLVRSDADNGEEDDHRLFMDEDDDDMFQPAYARAAGGDEDAKPAKKKAVKKRAASGSRPSGVKKPRKAPAKKTASGTKTKPAAKPQAKK